MANRPKPECVASGALPLPAFVPTTFVVETVVVVDHVCSNKHVGLGAAAQFDYPFQNATNGH